MKTINLTLKEVITITIFVFSVAGTYFKLDSDMDYLKAENVQMSEKVTSLENKLNSYSGLPRQVEAVGKTAEANAKMLGVIHDGLVAEGIIPPRVR